MLASIAAARTAYSGKLTEIRELHRGGEPNVPTMVDNDLRPLAGHCHASGAALCVAALQAATLSQAQPHNHAHAPAAAQPQQISRAGSQVSLVGPAVFFTGRVRIDPVWPADKDINASGNLVTFEPGARAAWHTHPAGQRLMVVSGVGLTQEWGRPVQEIRPGDVIWCPPGVKHWHGAAPATASAEPRIWLGNISPSITHITGPQLTLKKMT